MDKKLDRYKKLYAVRKRSLTFDWKDRRSKIALSDDDTGYCTQERFAAMVGLSLPGYRQLETGVYNPTEETFCRVLAMFDDFEV